MINSNSFDFFIKAAKQLGIPLPSKTLPQFQVYFRELLSWNNKFNLTKRTRVNEVYIDHFIDSLLPQKFIPPEINLVDLGSGGGFPGIPLKIIRPDIRVTLVDSHQKKVFFQRHIIRTLNLKGIEAIHQRVEKLPAFKVRYDVCVGRAFAPLYRFIDLALPLRNPKGLIISMSGSDWKKQLKDIKKDLPRWGISIDRSEEFILPYDEKKRAIIVFK